VHISLYGNWLIKKGDEDMNIIEISALENGSHRNQNGNFESIPFGWAAIPNDMETPNFPFGEIEVKEIDGVMTVTKWTAGTMPKAEDVEQPISEIEQLRADIDYIAALKGVVL
jgi:hypothetical protein